MFLCRSLDLKLKLYTDFLVLDMKQKYEIKLTNLFKMAPELQVGLKSSRQWVEILLMYSLCGLILARMKKEDNVPCHFCILHLLT